MSIVRMKNKKNGVVYLYESISYWDKEKKQQKNGRIPSFEYKRTFCGATLLFDQIGKKLGILKDLETCFPGKFKQILSLAYYLILEEHNPMSRFEKWAYTHPHPYGSSIASQRISELFASIAVLFD